MKINKNAANFYIYYEKYNRQYYVYCTRTTMSTVQELHIII